MIIPNRMWLVIKMSAIKLNLDVLKLLLVNKRLLKAQEKMKSHV